MLLGLINLRKQQRIYVFQVWQTWLPNIVFRVVHANIFWKKMTGKYPWDHSNEAVIPDFHVLITEMAKIAIDIFDIPYYFPSIQILIPTY